MTCGGADPSGLCPDQAALFDADMATFRAALGADLPVAAAVDVLTRCNGDTEQAIKWLLDAAAEKGRAVGVAPVVAQRDVDAAEGGIGGAADPSPPLPLVKVEAADEGEVKVNVKTEPVDDAPGEMKVKVEAPVEVKVKVEAPVEAGVKVESPSVVEVKVKSEPIEAGGDFHEQSGLRVKEEGADEVDVKEEEQPRDSPIKEQSLSPRRTKEEGDSDSSEDEVEIMDPPPKSKKRPREGDVFIDLTTSHPVPYLNPKPIRAMPLPGAMPSSEWRMVVAPPPAELDEYPPDRREWCFFKKSYATGLSTCRGRKLLDAGEVVHFAFPSYDRFPAGLRMTVRQAIALSEIVRFSTNRSGEIGKLSPVWAKCLAPLVSSSQIMVQGKMVFPMMELRLMQEVLLYVSFYVHRSSMYLIAPENLHHPDNPLHPLFKLLRRFGEPNEH